MVKEDKLDSFLSMDRLLQAEERAIQVELGRAEAFLIRARIEKNVAKKSVAISAGYG